MMQEEKEQLHKDLRARWQNPTYKVKLKFKVGDWVVFNNQHQSIYQVEKIEDGYYILTHTHGGTFRVCTLHDEKLRLWTIQDAKDGDVLYSHNKNLLWIYKDETTYHISVILDYIQYGCISIKCSIVIPLDTCPATKEHRDILFKAMLKEGYEWDEEKKELKKIEQKLD